jgi:hypothetical protein
VACVFRPSLGVQRVESTTAASPRFRSCASARCSASANSASRRNSAASASPSSGLTAKSSCPGSPCVRQFRERAEHAGLDDAQQLLVGLEQEGAAAAREIEHLDFKIEIQRVPEVMWTSVGLGAKRICETAVVPPRSPRLGLSS